jgi:hypothetical protein
MKEVNNELLQLFELLRQWRDEFPIYTNEVNERQTLIH